MKRHAIPVLFFLLPFTAFAWVHSLVLVPALVIDEPTTAQLFFGDLSGEAMVYRMESKETWNLTLGLLAPASISRAGKFDAVVVNESSGTVASVLEAGSTEWQRYTDRMTGNQYLRGPVLEQELPAGSYRIVVTSSGNTGRYVLAIGSVEGLSLTRIIKDVLLLPRLKKDFFEVASYTLLRSPLMIGFGVLMIFLGVSLGMWVRRHPVSLPRMHHAYEGAYQIKNIEVMGRIVRLAIGSIFLVLAICTTWNPVLFIVAGFCFYQAFTAWCALFAVLGRNSCEVT